MNSARRPQPHRRRPPNRSPSWSPSWSRGQSPQPLQQVPVEQIPAHHHHVTIDRANAAYWIAHIRQSASRARVEDGPSAGNSLDQMADDLAACIAADWRDADGCPVQQWQYHMWVLPHPSGQLETIIELWPEHLAA